MTDTQQPFPLLETDRLILRAFMPDDAPVVQRLAGVWEIASTTENIPHPYEDGMAEEWISSHQELWNSRKALTLAVVFEPKGVIGAIGFRFIQSQPRAELGYWIAAPFWGQGFATEAAEAVLDFGFSNLRLNRIEARHFTRNPASGRVMEKLGMTREGLLRQHVLVRGQFEDAVIYSVLKSDRRRDWKR